MVFVLNRKIPIWIAVWILTRAFMVARVGFWQPAGPEYEDVKTYESWSNFIAANHALPSEESWQYPPAAAFLMLLPRIGGGSFGISFIVLMLLFDLIGFWLMTRFAREEEGRDVGVWIWLLGLPLLYSLPILRFDLVPTVAAMAALLVVHRRPGCFGAIAGAGAAIKVWPAFILFGEWDRQRLLRAVVTALATVGAVFLVSAAAFGDPFGFLANQGNRGLEIEAVAALPWQLRQVVTGEEPPVVGRSGTNEIGSDLGDAIAKILGFLAIALLVVAAWWWLQRERGIRRGREDLAEVALSRDLVFAIALLSVVISRVFSTQYMIWLVGLGAVVLSSHRTRLSRAAWVVMGAVAVTAGLRDSPANLVIRNFGLLYASLDAAVVLTVALRRPSKHANSAASTGDRAADVVGVEQGQ